MTVSTLNTENNFIADGATDTFAFDFQVQFASDVKSFSDEVEDLNTLIVLNPDQVIAPGGSAQFLSGSPANGSVISIRRETPRDQLNAYVNGGDFPSASHESALDKLTMMVQEILKGSILITSIIDIGDWDMDLLGNVTVPISGIDFTKVRALDIIIRNDIGSAAYQFVQNGDATQEVSMDAGGIILKRLAGGIFDSTAFNATPYNRGWITVRHVP